MPYSIFFNEGYAIHGSYEISHLGRPASHGCIRLHPENAAVLFALVKERIGDTTIMVTGDRQERVVRSRADASAPRRVPRSRQPAPRQPFFNDDQTFSGTPNFMFSSPSWHGR